MARKEKREEDYGTLRRELRETPAPAGGLSGSVAAGRAAVQRGAASAAAAPVRSAVERSTVSVPRSAQGGEGTDAGQAAASRPAAPEPTDRYGVAYDAALERYAAAAPFSYDYRTDPRWAAYQKEYARNGQRAAEDVLGRVSAQTGGMPSTAAVTAAQQAGDLYAAQLADKIPELYDLAYAMYTGEQDRLYRQLSALRDARADEQDRYAAALRQWNADREFDYRAGQDAQAQRNADREFDYRAGQDAQAQANADREYEYRAGQDAQKQANADREYDYRAGQDAQKQANADREYEYRAGRDARADAVADAELAARSGDYRPLAALGVDVSGLGERRWGYSDDGGVYEIGSRKGLDFIAGAAPGQSMRGGDGSVWTVGEDGTVTITRDGRSWTVAGTQPAPAPEPESAPEKPELTAAQVNAALKNGIVTDKVLAAYEYYYGAPWGGAAGGGAGRASGAGAGSGSGGDAGTSAGGGALPVDRGDVLALGYGPISDERLSELIDSGAVEEYEEDGRLRFRRTDRPAQPDRPRFTDRVAARFG